MCGKYTEDKLWLWSTLGPLKSWQPLTEATIVWVILICNGLSTCQCLVLGAESNQNSLIPYCWVGGSMEQWAGTSLDIRPAWDLISVQSSSFGRIHGSLYSHLALHGMWLKKKKKNLNSATLDPESEVWVYISSLSLWALISEFLLCLSKLNIHSKKAAQALNVSWNWSYTAIFQGLTRRLGL